MDCIIRLSREHALETLVGTDMGSGSCFSRASFDELDCLDMEELACRIYDLLGSYRIADCGQIPIALDPHFPPADGARCRVRWMAQEDLEDRLGERIRVILPRDGAIFECIEMCGCLDVDPQGKELQLHCFKEAHRNALDHLKAIITDPSCPYLAEDELRRVLVDFNRTPKDCEGPQTIDRRFDGIVGLQPDHPAVVDAAGTHSYREVAWLSERMAGYMSFCHPRLRGARVGICIGKSVDLVAALLAIIRVGACYVPVDPAYPPMRIQEIIQEAAPEIMLCDGAFLARHAELLKGRSVLLLEEMLVAMQDLQRQAATQGTNQPGDLAYIVFTSGSTGRPKGVMIEHRNVVNLVQGALEVCSLGPGQRVLCVASIGFDAAGWDIYGALLTGATLYLAPEGIQTRADEMVEYLSEHAISLATLTPSVLGLLPERDLPALRTLVVMGDRPQRRMMDEWSRGRTLINGYGPTETTIGASLAIYAPGTSESCIGRPLLNYQFYIIDEMLRPVPIGIPGEICIGGAGLARGYLNADELTAAKFITLNLDGRARRVYRTGDLGMWTPDGQVEFLGRVDHQVKVRGIRIETQEIETLMNQYQGVTGSVVVAYGTDANKRLAGYFTCAQPGDPVQFMDGLSQHLKQYLHPGVVPDSLMRVDAFRLNAHGKIDRSCLPAPASGPETTGHVPPRNREEAEIRKVFMSVLDRGDVGIFDDFFNLGGHSLTATQIAARMTELYKGKARISTKDVFENPTVAALAERVQGAGFAGAGRPEIVVSPSRRGRLTHSQERLWYLEQFDSTDVSYNLPLALHLQGVVDLDRMEEALDLMVQRHETFRTLFTSVDGVPFQQVLDRHACGLGQLDYCRMTAETDELDTLLTELCRHPFNLGARPPVRIRLIALRGENPSLPLGAGCVLAFAKHNIITDAWSEGLILKELFRAYNCLGDEGQPVVLPHLTYQLLDIANHQKEYQAASGLENQLTYWKGALQGYEEFNYPTDFPRQAVATHAGQRISHAFPGLDWHGRLKAYCRQAGVTPFMLVMACLNGLIHRYTGSTDMVLGTALAGRNRRELENVTGFFVNTLPIRTRLQSSTSFQELLQGVKGGCLDAYANQDVPFDWIVEQAHADRSLNRNPLFQIMVILQNADEELLPPLPGIAVSRMQVQTGTSMFDMVWNFGENADGLFVQLDYACELFDQGTILRLIANFERFLSACVENDSVPLANLGFLSEGELAMIARLAEGPQRPLLRETLQEWIQEALQRGREEAGPALVAGTLPLTYPELAERVAHICARLPRDGGRQERIGILLNRSVGLVTSILAIISEGQCYVPLDPDYPAERLAYMVADADLDALVTETALLPLAHQLAEARNPGQGRREDLKVLCLDGPDGAGPDRRGIEGGQARCAAADDLAYILYTSGTTGNPKGVMITQANLVNFCEDMIERLGFHRKQRMLSITTVSFDIFGLEIFCTLLAGAEITLCDQETARNPVALANLFNREQPTLMQATPTIWMHIIDHIFPRQETSALCGGEALPPALLGKMQAKGFRVWNLYGPTETTIWSTAADLSRSSHVHIGRPIANTQCHILDAARNPVPVGVIGKLHLTGQGVALGYWRKPELTGRAFHPWEGGACYETGDLARWNHEGNLVFCGRSDYQVKIRGNRIELGDIEYHLTRHPWVEAAVCHLTGDRHQPQIAAYLVLRSGAAGGEAELDAEAFRSFLKSKLPSAAIPTAFVVLDSFPLTQNRKVDRKRLPAPDQRFGMATACHETPGNRVEAEIQAIWEEVLTVKGISVTENFFNLGGHSLHIPQIVSRINKRFGAGMTIRDFILNASIREVSLLAGATTADLPSELKIP
ncbi:hypothetical protein METESE_09590 [Mesoterricola sediminis]|uniref:Carrier domain-containing protein n=1 Tax=Mesoterricola sediminis TaxID=2927980 RepID=A0AA48GMV1_9BACT|nr:hypothetical protein METESE_09590 [Mesoterricola sediminis]